MTTDPSYSPQTTTQLNYDLTNHSSSKYRHPAQREFSNAGRCTGD